MRRALIAAAGTGGHIFPALAVAEELRDQGWQVDWLGTKEGRLDAKVVPEAGFPLHTIAMIGVRGHGIKRLLQAPFILAKSVRQCQQLLASLKPDVVVTFGGYVCAPMGVAAKLAKVPLVVHEQNAVAGMTTRLLAPLATTVLLGLPLTKKRLAKGRLVGNPVRRSLLELSQVRAATEHNASPLTVLVVGGSLGAKVLNETVPAALARLRQPVIVNHQCGQGNQQSVTTAYDEAPQHRVTVTEFIDDMASAYRHADLVICRAGALTVAELAVLGLPAIFVPLPHAVDDHQTANARTLVDANGAVLMAQQGLTVERLAKQLQSLLHEPQQLWKMARFARQTGRPDATTEVVKICSEVAA